jgi:hypothetical protein
MNQNRMHSLGFVIPLVGLDNILRRHSPLRKINVTCMSASPPSSKKAMFTLLLVDTQYDDDFVASDSDEFVDTSDPPSGEFGEEDHAFDVVVLEEFDVGAHFGDLTHLHDDELVDGRELILVEPAVARRTHTCNLLACCSVLVCLLCERRVVLGQDRGEVLMNAKI